MRFSYSSTSWLDFLRLLSPEIEEVRVSFEVALKRLATSLQTPVIPGELENWSVAVRNAAGAANGELQQQIATVHASEYAQIVKEDPELFRQVEQLKEGDRASLERSDSFRIKLDALMKIASHSEPNELRAQEQVKNVVDEGLALVMHVEKQEVARRTWLQEAFNRERGVGD